MSRRPAFRVTFQRDDNGRWLVRCPQLQGAHSHGRALASARANLREAIALVLDLDDDMSFDLVEEVRLPDTQLQNVVERARVLRQQAAEGEEAAQTATLAAVAAARKSGAILSIRDLADLLGLSHQRVQQLSAGASNGARTSRPIVRPKRSR